MWMDKSAPLVVVSPYPDDCYTFVSIMRDIFVGMGYETTSLRKASKSFPPFKGITAIELNWFEEVNFSSYLKARAMVAIKSVLLRYWKSRNISVLFTIHNRTGHSSPNDAMTRILRSRCCDYADAILILSDETREILEDLNRQQYERCWRAKTVLLEHPSFVPFGCESFSYPKHAGEGPFRFLFVGTVNRYKNIDAILDVAEMFDAYGMSANFTIAGTSNDGEYLKHVTKRAVQMNNVVFRNERLSDRELTRLVRQSDLLILPYDRESTLNSGTCVLAFSNGRNVVCPVIGTIKEYPEGTSFCYEDECLNEGDRAAALYGCAARAYKEYYTNKEKFESREHLLQDITNSKFSQENAGRIIGTILGRQNGQ